MITNEFLIRVHFNELLGKDKTIRIWNFKTGCVELLKRFAIETHSIDIHPSGLFAALGFSDQFRLMKILLEDIQVSSSAI